MKIRLNQIASPKFAEAFSRLLTLSLPLKTAYWVAKTARRLDEENRLFLKLREELLQKHAKKEGDNYRIENQELAAQVSAEITALLETEVELPLSEPIQLPEDARIQPQDLILLDGLVSVLAEEPKPPTPFSP